MEENLYNKSEKSILQDMNEEQIEALRQSIETDSPEGTAEPDHLYSSALTGLSDRLNNQFEALDGKKKARMILAAAIAILILGLYFIYRFFSFFF